MENSVWTAYIGTDVAICLEAQTVNMKSQLYSNGQTMRKQIIVIDDDEAVRDSMCAFLECMGFDVSSFDSAKQFLQTEHYDTVCCFIVDVHMPEMTGVDFLEIMHKTRPYLPVILVSGNISASIRERAEDAGALAIFEKPFAQDELLHLLKAKCPNLESSNNNHCI